MPSIVANVYCTPLVLVVVRYRVHVVIRHKTIKYMQVDKQPFVTMYVVDKEGKLERQARK